MERMIVFAIEDSVFPLVRRAVGNEINSAIDFYHAKAKKENPKPVDIKIMERTLEDIKLLQDFILEMDLRKNFSR